ncbi:hypothetical protein ODJ79_37990 [Actinoplanes sp. KI2]|uniref:hypothetical protein n=1 Tax=Actinoplanes sp. KI2 TaxID=2983315 RepID=UPI0021D5F1C1|nr:hypothetical protein [Actinoplanes sp. KI2]MCU7729542.1 hypothetical protein [Actinoplanes sp. KI2]
MAPYADGWRQDWLYSVAVTTGPTVFAAGTRWDLNETGSLSDRTLSMRGTGS